MHYPFRILLPLILFLLCIKVTAQDSANTAVKLYGLDPVLHNGKLYTYYPPPGTGGNQYFTSSFYPTGSIWLKGIRYDNLRLNYDVYNQQLILFYKNSDGSAKTIIVSDAWLNAFTLGKTRFILLNTTDSVKHIYQEIGKGKKSLLYLWRKDWILEPSIGAYAYIFTPPQKEMFLCLDNKLFIYKNNRSFISLLKPEEQSAVKKYLRQNRIRVKKAGDEKMMLLMDFINTLNSK